MIANILKPETAYVFEYPQFNELADEQLTIFWPWNEIKVEKDKQDLLTNLTEAEYHAVVTTLKLFTKYELYVGNEYWTNRICRAFQRPEIQRMAICFANVELNSHAPFYAKINIELGLSTKEFYESYVNDPALAERMNFIQSLVDDPDLLISIAGFSMVEGSILYSNFAFLKHFQSNGKNLIPNIVRGINMSARDENLHAIGGALLFKTLLAETYPKNPPQYIEDRIKELAKVIYEHEARIIDMIFEKGPIKGCIKEELQEFVKSRINLCLNNLGYKPLFKVTNNPIAEWFYLGINNYMMNDFFQGVGREYRRGWNALGFVW